jgi:hypothetical protein
MSCRQALKYLICWVLFSTMAGGVAQAQWSLLAPGNREPSPRQNRYYMLVLANPIPGMENDFNDWYTNMMLGDLTQLPGFVGAQRFRIISDAGLDPRPTVAGYQKGYLTIWDQQGPDNTPIDKLMRDSLEGGKISHGAGFDYRGFGTEGVGGTYQALGPRVSSGKKPWMPASTDLKTRRPNRYIVMDFSNPAAGKEGEFESTMNQHIKDILALPGWMAAQRFKVMPGNARGRGGRSNILQYLTVWEVEGPSPQAPQTDPARPGQSGKYVSRIQTALNEAIKDGKIKQLPIDESSRQFTYWEPITPFITRADYDR